MLLPPIADTSASRPHRLQIAVKVAANLVTLTLALVSLLLLARPNSAAPPTSQELARQFTAQLVPLLTQHCGECHASDQPEAELDLSVYHTLDEVNSAHPVWAMILARVQAGEMPPADSDQQFSAGDRRLLVDWITTVRQLEAERTSGDPGPVLARRLSNVEFDHCIRDLTGVDIRPTRVFPVDPANAAGFDNSGESLNMSPALLNKYLSAAREVAEHLVLTPTGINFAPHPVVTDTDRDKYCVKRIVEFYQRQPTDYADYFFAAWKVRQLCDQQPSDQQPGEKQSSDSQSALKKIAAEYAISGRYLQLIWNALQTNSQRGGHWDSLQAQWQALPDLPSRQGDLATSSSKSQIEAQVRIACAKMRDYVSETRKQYEPHFDNLHASGIHNGSQPFVLWKNKQYAQHRRTADMRNFTSDGALPTAQFTAAAHSFCELFPDTFYVSERGRDYLDTPKDQQEKGRLLSAGFHSMMGYFRDDRPLMELILDEAGQQELDALWRELDFSTASPQRQYQGFLWFERTDSGTMRDAEFDFARPEDLAALSEPLIARLSEVYYAKAQRLQAGDTELAAIADYFREINEQIRWVERARREAESPQLEALVELAARAARRPLSSAQADELRSFYYGLRSQQQLSHEEALQDTLVSILMSPQFCYRIDLLSDSDQPRPLDDFELASRLSFFLWASAPDADLMQLAADGRLHLPDVLLEQTRRMLADTRVRGLATEFAANWLDFRRFEQHNSVDRQRFPSFDDALRAAMFEEPLRFFVDMAQHNHSTLDLLYAERTFVNRPLAEHYGLRDLPFKNVENSTENSSGEATAEETTGDEPTVDDEWLEVSNASAVGRGGLLPMAVFMTQNAPGLRTSPVKRGYWVVRRLLGERIAPPPPNVPELPPDESLLGDLTLRETLAKHRDHPSCAGCHNRFDSIGLIFENYGPIGELRTVDMGGRPVDTSAEFPDGSARQGVDQLRDYLRQSRQTDFLDNLHRKLLTYALSRSLQLSDEPLLGHLQQISADNQYRFHALVEAIVTGPQFLNKRGRLGPAVDP